MQVSGKNESNATVVSTNAPKEFMIANTPDFFNILSSSLYSDPILAVVRETICNAWDANIAIQCQGSISVGLKDGYFTVKDCGPGIPKDQIVEIYGTYGASTKTNQSNQTGGFGLGCKSPFAYCDNFEVISCCNGMETIYQMVKASDDTDGKPAINEICTNPTTRYGLTVKIPVAPEDENKFIQAIYKVTVPSEQPTFFNCAEVNHCPKFDDYIFMTNGNYAFNFPQTSRIFIKYGEVLYPLRRNNCNTFENLYEDVDDFIKRFGQGVRYGSGTVRPILVIKAKENTLSITPSREELRNTEANQKVLRGLLHKVWIDLHTNVAKRCAPYVKEWVETIKLNWKISESTWWNPYSDLDYLIDPFVDKEQVHKYLHNFYFVNDLAWLFAKAIAPQKYVKNLKRIFTRKRQVSYTAERKACFKWFYKYVLRHYVKNFEEQGLDIKRLSFKYPAFGGNRAYSFGNAVPEWSNNNILHFLDSNVFIGTKDAKTYDGGKHLVPPHHIFYRTTAKGISNAVEKLKKCGLTPILLDAEPKEEKEKKAGLKRISWISLQKAAEHHYYFSRYSFMDKLENISVEQAEEFGTFKKYKAVFVWNQRTQNSNLEPSMLYKMGVLLDDEIVIVNTQAEMKYLMRHYGMIPVDEYVKNKIKEYFSKPVTYIPSEDQIVSSIESIAAQQGIRNFFEACKRTNTFFYKFMEKSSTSEMYTLLHYLNKHLKVNVEEHLTVDKSYLKFRKDFTQNSLRFCPKYYEFGLIAFIRTVLLKRIKYASDRDCSKSPRVHRLLEKRKLCKVPC